MSSPLPKNWFVSKGPDKPQAVQIVESVDDLAVGGYAHIRTIRVNGEAHGRYSMRVVEYDSTFVERFRPAVADDLIEPNLGAFRYPANASPEWIDGTEPEPTTEPESAPESPVAPTP